MWQSLSHLAVTLLWKSSISVKEWEGNCERFIERCRIFRLRVRGSILVRCELCRYVPSRPHFMIRSIPGRQPRKLLFSVWMDVMFTPRRNCNLSLPFQLKTHHETQSSRVKEAMGDIASDEVGRHSRLLRLGETTTFTNPGVRPNMALKAFSSASSREILVVIILSGLCIRPGRYQLRNKWQNIASPTTDKSLNNLRKAARIIAHCTFVDSPKSGQ